MNQSTVLPVRSRGRVPAEILAGLAVLVTLCAVLDTGAVPMAGAAGVYLVIALVMWQGLWRSGASIGWANRVTLLRGVLISYAAGALAAPAVAVSQQWVMVAVVLVALALDGVDGWVARRRDEVSAFGARFDMELDALLILVLCLWLVATGVLGGWVLALGGMRYAFVLAAVCWPYLAEPLPESRRRKAICVVQVAALLVAITPAVDEIIKMWTVAGALAALTLSFAVDVGWLYRHANR